MNFSKTTSYAFTVLNFLARNQNERYSAMDLHESLSIPWQYLRQLLTALQKAGFVESSKGRKGGFLLASDPKEINLAKVVRAVEGPDIFSTCILGHYTCPFENDCALHETWVESRDKIAKLLDDTTLDMFLVSTGS